MNTYILLPMIALVSSCMSYKVTQSGIAKDVVAKSQNCDFIIATDRLEKPYEEIGIIDASGDVRRAPRNAADFKEYIKQDVCALGGDAVLAEINGQGGYLRGTVVRWKTEPETTAHQIICGQGVENKDCYSPANPWDNYVQGNYDWMGNPVVEESIGMEVIREVIHSHREKIRSCYTKNPAANPNMSRMSVKFTIGPKGLVTQATVSQINNPALEICLTNEMLTWKFPEPKGVGVVIVSF